MAINQLHKDFSDSLEGLNHYIDDLEKMLGQTLQVLAKFTQQAPFDLSSMLNTGQVQRQQMQLNTQRVMGHLFEMDQLVRTSALITMSLEINRVLNEVADTVIYLTGAERAFLLLMTEADQDWKVMVARNAKAQDITDEGVTFSRGVIQSAIRTGEPILSTNAQEDDRFQNMQSVIRHDLRSVLVIPMLLQGKPLGVLYLDNRLTADVFHQKSLPVISAFANQAAIAIENARLFEQVQDNLRQAQQEVQRLRIRLDQDKLQNQVDEIVESDYFRELSSLAKKRRDDNNHEA